MSDLNTMTDADLAALIAERNLLRNTVARQRAEIAALENALAHAENRAVAAQGSCTAPSRPSENA